MSTHGFSPSGLLTRCEVGDHLLDGTVAGIKGAASPRGFVTFTDGTTGMVRYGSQLVVLPREAAA